MRSKAAALAALVLIGPGCGPDVSAVAPPEPAGPTSLDRVVDRGALRFLVQGAPTDNLPRVGGTQARDRHLARTVAASLGVRARFVRVPRLDDLVPALLRGEGDVILERYVADPQSALRRTRPVRLVAEMLVGRDDGPRPKKLSQLDGHLVHVSSRAHHGLALEQRLAAPGDDAGARTWGAILWDHRPPAQIAADVGRGRVDFTVLDTDRLHEIQRFEPNLVPLFELAAQRPVTWALRADDEALSLAVDDALAREGVLGRPTQPSTADLDAIQARGELRVLTRNHEVSYFIHRGRRYGLDFELVRELAKSLGVRPVMIVPPRSDLLIDWLREGRGDVIAASFVQTATRSAQVAFSQPYLRTRELVVGHALDADAPRAPHDLQGREIHVPESSSHYETLVDLEPQLGPYDLAPSPEDLETTVLLDRVADELIPLTVADGHLLKVKRTYEPNVTGLFPLPEPGGDGPLTRDIAFAVRPGNPKLLARIDRWLDSDRGRQMTRVMKARYLDNAAKNRRRSLEWAKSSGRISRYDRFIMDAAELHGIDWRLMAAQAYVESRFDPDAKSWAGAVGLFQLLPTTARSLGYEDLSDPAVSARAGAHYMRRLISKFDEPALPYRTRVHFALAAYNAGYGHVLDARKLARRRGLDPDRWFDHVEKAMLLLSQPRFAKNARFGYCRGKEPVRYVRRIQTLYEAYTDITRG